MDICSVHVVKNGLLIARVDCSFKQLPLETRMVVLAEKIIFFQDNGGKLQLLQVDNKVGGIVLNSAGHYSGLIFTS